MTGASKSIIPPPIRLIHLRHDIPDRTLKVRLYLWSGPTGDLGLRGNGPIRRQDQQIDGRKESRANCYVTIFASPQSDNAGADSL
jgi:hypothetical protein